MAIQPFAMQAQTANFMLPSEAMAGAERLKGLQNQNAMVGEERQRGQMLDQAYRESGGDINKMISNPNLGFEAGTRLQSLSAENVKADAAAKAANIDQQLKMLDAGAQIVGGANDQASWDAARSQMAEMFGQEAANRLPAQYDPAAQQRLQQQSLSFKDKLDLQRQQLAMQREDRMFNQQDRMYQLAVGREGRLASAGSGDSGNKPPAHYRWTPDGNLEPIPGGGADIKAQAQTAKLEAQKNKDIVKLENADAGASQTLALIDQIAGHEGKGGAVGFSSVLNAAAIPGSPRQDFLSKLDQLKGQQFLQAFESLKGGGAITEVEGKKAEQAIANMNTAQSEKQFDAALGDFRKIIQDSQVRVKSRMGQYNADNESLGLGGAGGSLPDGVTEDDVQETMRANNMSRDQVLQRLGGR